MTTLRRAAERHLTLAALHEAKPKPEKQKKTKRVPIEKRRKRLEKQCADMLKLIIAWRDGQVCVMGQMDGARCGNGLMWNHLISQSQSAYLRLDLSNVFFGCGNHNLLDFHGDKTLTLWFVSTFGVPALQALQSASRENSGKKRTEAELETLLAHLDDQYQNRFTADLTIGGLVMGGYYGSIIKGCFDGK